MRRERDPIASFRFLLELGFVPIAGFSEVTGLQAETKLIEVREGGRNGSPLKFPDGGSVSNVVLKRGLATGAASNDLFEWQRAVMEGEFGAEANANQRPADADADIDRRISIVLQDEAGAEVRRWRLFRAFPVKWTGPELKAQASEVAIEALELACEGIEVA